MGDFAGRQRAELLRFLREAFQGELAEAGIDQIPNGLGGLRRESRPPDRLPVGRRSVAATGQEPGSVLGLFDQTHDPGPADDGEVGTGHAGRVPRPAAAAQARSIRSAAGSARVAASFPSPVWPSPRLGAERAEGRKLVERE